jgi:EmrB/QacA subfamily drug resistance transporter
MDPRVWRVAGVVLLAPMMTNLDSTIVNVALSSIRDDLHAPLATAQWTLSGYLLALALALPMNGWLVDRLGAKRVYVGCVTAFTLASLLCGAARTMDGLIAFRVLQGMAGGLLTPMTQLMIARVAGRHLPRVMGYTALPVLIVPVLGPVVAGAVLRYAAWPWLFYLNVPLGLVALGLALSFLPGDTKSVQRRPFDLVGFLTLSPGLVGLLYGLDSGVHGVGAATAFVGAVLVGIFLWRARRMGSAALIDLGLFRNPTFAVAATTQFCFNGILFSGQFLVPLFLISGCGLSPARAGWFLAPMGLGMMCVFPLMGLLTERFGCRAVSSCGALVTLLGTLPLVWMSLDRFSPALTVASLFVRGAGLGAIGIPSLSAAYASIARERLPIATTAVNIVQRLGGPLATTLVATVMALSSSPRGASSPRSFTLAFAVLIGLQALALGAASRLPVVLPRRT